MHIVREASEKDLPVLVKLGKQLLDLHFEFDPEYYDLEENAGLLFRDWLVSQLAQPNQFIFVAEVQNTGPRNGEIVGFISGFIKSLYPWFKTRRVGHVSYLVIDSACRNQGIGKLLSDESDRWFRSRKIKYVEVYVEGKNYPGQKAWFSYHFMPFKKFLRKRY